ncbi:MAG TPA: hypothetical protein VL088_04520, partial [Pedobacter sp.]|nr:hypothetical protein [Pedobacter sp.]
MSDQLLQNFTGHPEHCYHEFLYSIDFATHSIPSLALIILAPDFVAQIVETPNAINFSDSGSGAAGSGGILVGAGSPDEQRPGNKSQFIDSLVVKKIAYHKDMYPELNYLFENSRRLNPGLLDQAKSVLFMSDRERTQFYSHYILTLNDLGVEHNAVSGKVITHYPHGVFIAQNADGEYRYAMVEDSFDAQCRRITKYENTYGRGNFDAHVSAKSENFSLEVASLLTTPLYNIKEDTTIFLYDDITSLRTDFYGDCTKYIDRVDPNSAQKIFSNNALGYQLVDRSGLNSSNCDFQSH